MPRADRSRIAGPCSSCGNQIRDWPQVPSRSSLVYPLALHSRSFSALSTLVPQRLGHVRTRGPNTGSYATISSPNSAGTDCVFLRLLMRLSVLLPHASVRALIAGRAATCGGTSSQGPGFLVLAAHDMGAHAALFGPEVLRRAVCWGPAGRLRAMLVRLQMPRRTSLGSRQPSTCVSSRTLPTSTRTRSATIPSACAHNSSLHRPRFSECFPFSLCVNAFSDGKGLSAVRLGPNL